jgi:glutathione S-transferase
MDALSSAGIADRRRLPKFGISRPRRQAKVPVRNRGTRAVLTLYTSPTPNGYKVSVALEELDLPYKVHSIDLMKGEQKEPWFLSLNPNGRIPVLVDDGFPIFESGAILIHLAEKTGRLMPSDPKGRSKVLQWLMFQMGGIGPMMGQANVFYRYFPERIQPAIDRYHGEVKRLFGVMDRHLATSDWLADDYSIADIATWCWTRTARWSGVDPEPFEHLARWHRAIAERPAAQRGIAVPSGSQLPAQDEQAAKTFSEAARTIVEMGKPG